MFITHLSLYVLQKYLEFLEYIFKPCKEIIKLKNISKHKTIKSLRINIVNEARTFTPLCRYMGMLGIEVAYTDSLTYNSLMKGTHCHLQLCLNCFYRLVKISIIGTLRNKETKDGKICFENYKMQSVLSLHGHSL